ncbi:MAG: hypothetical protein CVV64_14655 [Candidatus Wallbacteria bacterium HGW-Wallbacteria-1]|uniref:Uncharacterized protein n=1 Tax=Candidatus Wallbacteria bacterium HGW-Wallbacteria-1 TaxID=2013854 RepID=A0A2N1PM14_9BACT|nr:MAG: hypothetical protein CVV64_14655 [Candidatus Wallbacteria bacterium HGW-Wallbacteria-1]
MFDTTVNSGKWKAEKDSEIKVHEPAKPIFTANASGRQMAGATLRPHGYDQSTQGERSMGCSGVA